MSDNLNYRGLKKEIIKCFVLVLIGGLILLSCGEKQTITTDTKTQSLNELEGKLFPYEKQFIYKNFPNKTPDYRAYRTAMEDVATQSIAGARSEGQWLVQGPGNIGARVNAIAINPSNRNEIMAGFSSGGVFRTKDNTQTWEPVFDSQPDLNIGEITYDPNDPNTVYVGTGDPNISSYPKIGSGIFKSVDGGDTWAYKGLKDASIISRIHVAPTDSDIIYVSTMGIPFIKTTERGVYKSIDGGDTWEHKLMINDSTGVIDMIVNPLDPNIIYAAGWNRSRNDSISVIVGPDARIHKSIDGGDTWTMLEGGLPIGDDLGRIGLAMSGQNYDNIYASYINMGGSDSCNASGSQLLGIWKSTNGGSSWSEINTLPESGLPCNALGGFAWYFGQVRVNPMDDDDIFILGVDMWRTKDGGSSWGRAVPYWALYTVHADKHDLIFDDGRMILATDGGIYESIDDGADWIDIENIPNTQFYRVAYNPHRPYIYYGGAQDNGTTAGNLDSINQWQRIYGGDGFTVDFDYSDSLIYYVSAQNGNVRVTNNGGENFESANFGFDNTESKNWDMPYFVSKHDPKILYAGRQSIYKGEYIDDMVTWSKISGILTDPSDGDNFYSHNISTVHQSPIVSDYLYAGTSDGLVWSTTDGGQNWNNVSEGIPYRYVSDIVASPTQSNTAYVSVTGYKSNDFSPHIFRTDDNGQSWEAINGNLPQIAINDILVHEDYDDKVLFVATDGGIYFTINAGIYWERLGDNMPIIEVYDMAYNRENDFLVAGTFSRGIQTFDLSQVNLEYDPSAVNEYSSPDIVVFPTVTSSYITAQWNDTSCNYYRVISLNGRSVKEGQMNGEKMSIDLSDIPNGSYVISFSHDHGIVSKKIIKI